MSNVLTWFAQACDPSKSVCVSPGDIGLTDPAKNPNVVLGSVLDLVYLWAGIVAVLVIIIAGILYSTSAGNPSHTKRAREAIIYAVVGLVMIIFAFAITQLVLGRIG